MYTYDFNNLENKQGIDRGTKYIFYAGPKCFNFTLYAKIIHKNQTLEDVMRWAANSLQSGKNTLEQRIPQVG